MKNSNNQSIETIFSTSLNLLFLIQSMIKVCELVSIGLETKEEIWGVAFIESQKCLLISLETEFKNIIPQLESLLDSF